MALPEDFDASLNTIDRRYPCTWQLSDVELRMIHCRAGASYFSDTTAFIPASKEPYLFGLAQALEDRYKHTGRIEDVLERIEICQTALADERASNRRSGFLCLLASALRVRFQRFGAVADLQDALRFHTEALSRHEGCSSARAWLCSELGRSIAADYRQHGSLERLSRSISFQQESLELRPPGHVYRYQSLHFLGSGLRTRFTATGNLDDLETSILHCREALALCPDGHRDRHTVLSESGSSYYRLYRETGDAEHLTLAITYHRQALRLRSTEHRNKRSRSLINLSTTLRVQASYLCNHYLVDEAIELAREALRRCPVGHHMHQHVTNGLAVALRDRYLLQDSLNDLEEAILLQRGVLQLSARCCSIALFDAAVPTCTCSTSQAVALPRTGGSSSGQTLVRTLRGVCQWEPLGGTGNAAATRPAKRHAKLYPRLHLTLHDLAINLRLYSKARNNAHDYEEAILLQLQAVKLCPDGHPDRSRCLFGLARLHLAANPAQCNLALALTTFSNAVKDQSRSIQLRLVDAVEFLDALERRFQAGVYPDDVRPMALEVYRHAISLLPRIAVFGAQARLRLQLLAKAEHLAINGAVHALHLMQPESAIEILAEGRAMFWTQHLRRRTSFGALPEELAGRLRVAARELDSTRGPTVRSLDGVYHCDARMRQLDNEFEGLIQEARGLPGLGRFMLHETYDTLSCAAERGPVVVLIPSDQACYAVIMPAPHVSPLRIDLTISQERLSKLCNSLRTFGRCRGDISVETEASERSTRIQPPTASGAEVLLKELWKKVVKPVIKELHLTPASAHNRRRLWWCPTGVFAFLPIHAAGKFTSREHKGASCSDYVVSSYTPTISSLLSTRQRHKAVPRSEARLLLAAVPRPFQGTPLEGVTAEIQAVKSVVQRSPSEDAPIPPYHPITVVGGASAADVLQALPDVAILHLACHGEQDSQDALNSGFSMRDSRLRVSDLMALNLRGAFLAFLSACETARGDDRQPDQAVHLAATMLFAGFRSVVGTMWSMHDTDGPLVARVFYRELFRGEGEYIDPDNVAYALDAAVHELRRLGLPPSRWAPYIHLGI